MLSVRVELGPRAGSKCMLLGPCWPSGQVKAQSTKAGVTSILLCSSSSCVTSSHTPRQGTAPACFYYCILKTSPGGCTCPYSAIGVGWWSWNMNCEAMVSFPLPRCPQQHAWFCLVLDGQP
eukprot:154616-Pelagomonas_calceolata.AAC.4